MAWLQPERCAAAQRVALAAGIVVALVGGGHLVAWLSGRMGSGIATTITMKTNASVCLLLAGLGLALLALRRGPRSLRLTAQCCVTLVLVLGLATLVEHLAQVDLGVDQVLATERPGAAAVLSPNRMGPPASICFTLLGTALLLLARRRPTYRLRTAHQPLAILALVAALVPAIGYLYGADELYGVARYTGIAWPTAVCLVVLAIGILCARPADGPMALLMADGPGGALVRRLLGPMVLLPLGLGWLRLAGERSSWFDAATGTSLIMVFFVVAFSAMLLTGGRWVVRSDAALRESEDATRRQLAEIQAIYDSAHVGLCVFDLNLRYLRINQRLAEINGLSAADHLGKTVGEILPSLGPMAQTIAERIARTGEGVIDVEFAGTTNSQPGLQRTWMEQWLPLKDRSGRVMGINVVVEETTDRKRAEEALRQSEERFRALVRAGSQVVYRMSPDWTDMLELQGGEFLADTATRSREWLQKYIHPDDQQHVSEVIAEAVRTGTVFELEHRVQRVDGTLGWVSSRAIPVRNPAGEVVEWFGAASDITARKRAEEALRQSEDRLKAALAIAELGVWEYDVAAARSHYDERCRAVFGISDGRPLANDEVFELIHAGDRPRVEREVAAALDPGGDGLFDTEYRIVRRDGAERWVAVRGHAIRPGGASVGTASRFVGTLMDITARRRDEQALREANAQLAEADRRKDEFIAILSHELRNPLAPIRYALPLIDQDRLGQAGVRAVTVINRQVDQLTRLVDELLDVWRITRGTSELRREAVTLDTIVTAAIEAASPAIREGGHTFSAAVACEPIWVYVDRGRMTQALTNVLNNAAKYTPAGGQIRLAADRADGRAVIRVRDNGIGITAEALPTLFEMFRQVTRADRPQGGLGVGLGLAKRLVELHGGSIEAHSPGIGQGSEFVVHLPLASGAGLDDVVATSDSARVIDQANARSLKVLIVDDNNDFVEMLAMLVENVGHDVRMAFNGRDAIATAIAYRPDVVLLDLGMPVMGGLEVARDLRRRPETADAHLVALTGWGHAKDREATREAGFDHHLTKPTDPLQLQQLLAHFAEVAVTSAQPRTTAESPRDGSPPMT